jgi:hypothetical protein
MQVRFPPLVSNVETVGCFSFDRQSESNHCRTGESMIDSPGAYAAVYCEQVFRKSVGVSPVCRRNADEK